MDSCCSRAGPRADIVSQRGAIAQRVHSGHEAVSKVKYASAHATSGAVVLTGLLAASYPIVMAKLSGLMEAIGLCAASNTTEFTFPKGSVVAHPAINKSYPSVACSPADPPSRLACRRCQKRRPHGAVGFRQATRWPELSLK